MEALNSRISIDAAPGGTLSGARIRLLEAIDEFGSINRAAKAVPLSYKAAWEAIDTLNNLCPQPLVTRVSKGRQGGGTQLTDYGKRMVALYRALESQTQQALHHAAGRLHDGGPGEMEDFGRLLKRLQFRSSARNQLAGRVVALNADRAGVDVEVRLQLDQKNELVAIITQESAESLALSIGRTVIALVKSSSILICTETGLALSARNQLWGEIEHVHAGVINDEVTIALPSGKRLTAVVTHNQHECLGLSPGTKACACFKASSVILVDQG